MDKIKQQILQEMYNQNLTTYSIAKAVSQKRTGGKSPASRYHSAIGKAIDNPTKSRLETLIDILETLGGEITISWGKQSPPTITRYINAPYEIVTDNPETPSITISHEE